MRMPVQLHIKHTRTPSRPQSSLFTAHHPHQSSREVFRPTFAPQPLCSPLRVRAYPPARPTTPIPKPTQAGARTKREHKLKVLGTDPHPTPQTEKQQYSSLRLDKPLTIHPRSLRYARAGPNGQRSSLLLSLPSFFPSASASARLSQSLGPPSSNRLLDTPKKPRSPLCRQVLQQYLQPSLLFLTKHLPLFSYHFFFINSVRNSSLYGTRRDSDTLARDGFSASREHLPGGRAHGVTA